MVRSPTWRNYRYFRESESLGLKGPREICKAGVICQVVSMPKFMEERSDVCLWFSSPNLSYFLLTILTTFLCLVDCVHEAEASLLSLLWKAYANQAATGSFLAGEATTLKLHSVLRNERWFSSCPNTNWRQTLKRGKQAGEWSLGDSLETDSIAWLFQKHRA